MDFESILKKEIPNHIAIILDGNGRWAKKRLLPRTMGHKKGLENLLEITKVCKRIGIKHLTVFAFSTENWNRPDGEVQYLMNAPVEYLKGREDKLKDSGVKILFLGRKDRFPKETLEAINKIEFLTQNNTEFVLNVAFDYGSRNELVSATKQIAELVKNNEIDICDIDEKMIEERLFTKNSPKLDLLIRTSGEIRISNFLLWQLSYSELYFTDCLWPDFNEEELVKAIVSFQGRKRRYGGLDKEER
jgi:undecaprenyl diphosphate synthase